MTAPGAKRLNCPVKGCSNNNGKGWGTPAGLQAHIKAKHPKDKK